MASRPGPRLLAALAIQKRSRPAANRRDRFTLPPFAAACDKVDSLSSREVVNGRTRGCDSSVRSSIEEVHADSAGLVFELKARGADARPLWAYRFRLPGRESARPQGGGFASRAEAEQALRKPLARLGPGGCAVTMALADLVAEYLGMQQGEPVTIAKLRWLLDKCRRRRSRPSTSCRRQRTRSCSRTHEPTGSTSAASAAGTGSQLKGWAGIEPLRGLVRPAPHVRDLRPAGGSPGICRLSVQGSRIAMIDHHYGHLTHDSREHAVSLLDALAFECAVDADGRRRRRPQTLLRRRVPDTS